MSFLNGSIKNQARRWCQKPSSWMWTSARYPPWPVPSRLTVPAGDLISHRASLLDVHKDQWHAHPLHPRCPPGISDLRWSETQGPTSATLPLLHFSSSRLAPWFPASLITSRKPSITNSPWDIKLDSGSSGGGFQMYLFFLCPLSLKLNVKLKQNKTHLRGYWDALLSNPSTSREWSPISSARSHNTQLLPLHRPFHHNSVTCLPPSLAGLLFFKHLGNPSLYTLIYFIHLFPLLSPSSS